MNYQNQKMATFIKFKRLENSISHREFAKQIYVSHGMVNNIENAKLLSLDQHLDNIFDCFHLKISEYTDQDEEVIQKVHQIIYQTIYYELPLDDEESFSSIYFEGIENTYLFIYYQLMKTCLYARHYINDSWLKKYFIIFDTIIYQFDEVIQQFYFILKYGYYKEKREFKLCGDIEKNFNLEVMDDAMKGIHYHLIALRYMYEGNITLEFEYFNFAKKYCEYSNNQRRLISLTTIECDIYEKLGDINKMINIFKHSIQKMDEIHFESLKYTFLSNLGIAYFQVNDFIKAIDYLNQSMKVNNDNLDLFYLIYSYMNIGEKREAIKLLENRYTVKCFHEVFYDLLNWCYQTLKRPYTKKCEYILQSIYKKYYSYVSIDTKKLILKLLIKHYEYQDNYFLIHQYQKVYIDIVGGNL